MSTTPLTDAINALTQYANETTGASDTTLSDAVGTLVAGYGGGGGGVFAKLYDNTLSANTRSVTINIEQAWRNYDILIIYANGEFTASDWLYWNIDSATLDNGKYSNQRKTINDPYLIVKAPMHVNTPASLVWQNGSAAIAVAMVGAIDMSTIGYFWLSGYSKDMVAGTKIKVYGGNYADF